MQIAIVQTEAADFVKINICVKYTCKTLDQSIVAINYVASSKFKD